MVYNGNDEHRLDGCEKEAVSLARVCPHCHLEATVDSDYCPACGAPMDEHAYQGEIKAQARAQAELPMRWHKFLTWFSLPLGMILAVVGLVHAVRELSGFDPALFKPEYLQLVKINLYVNVGVNLCRAVACPLAEFGLLKMRWRGVRAVLFLYLLQAAYLLLSAVLLLSIQAVAGNDLLAAAGSVALFFCNRTYYRKRKKLFVREGPEA